MLPFKTIIHLDRTERCPLYLQVVNEVIKRITAGVIPMGYKLPGGRKMADSLGLSRKTVMLAYEELEAQGWLEIKPNQGTFISSKIPVLRQRTLADSYEHTPLQRSAFPLNQQLDFLDYYTPPAIEKVQYIFDTGYPDVRLAPLKALAQSFQRVLNSPRHRNKMNYAADFNGNLHLRQELVKYLAETRGIKIGFDNILLTRGSLMAFSMIFRVLLAPDEVVVVGAVSFKVANNIIKIAGGKVQTVRIDREGICVDDLASICQRQRVRAVFVMPHHHHPTTVALSAERRMKLLLLAQQYGFAIIEDDYDYDFHYAASPILPMASADQNGSVIYVGTFSKTLAPGLRTGFIVAPVDFIQEMARLSRFMDCHGNTAQEKAIAQLFQEGIIKRHLKKSLKIYRQRRDLFCHLLQSELGDYVDFQRPEGGLAVWVNFIKTIPLPTLREAALQRGVLISRTVFQDARGRDLNAIRMGFGSLNAEELEMGMRLLRLAIDDL